MAVSLALNWNPPASSPIIDDAAASDRYSLPFSSSNGDKHTPRTSDGQHQSPRQRREPEPGVTSTPVYGGSSSLSGNMAYATSSSASAAAHSQARDPYRQHASQPSGSGSGTSPNHRNASSMNGHAGQPKSYASVASGASVAPGYPAVPMPSYGGVGLAPQAHHTAFHAQRGGGSGMAWSPYGTGPFYMGAPQATTTTTATSSPHSNVTETGRVRAHSNASRPSHPQQQAYSDTAQHYPGSTQQPRSPATYSTAPQLPLPGQAATAANGAGASGGYHPYRRAPRPSDPTGMSSTPTASSSVSASPPVLPMPSHVAPLGLPTFPEQARSSSNASSIGSPKAEVTTTERPLETSAAETGSAYSSLTMGGMRPSQSTPNLAAFAPPRHQEETTPTMPQRPTFSQRNSSSTSIERQRSESVTPTPYSHAPSTSQLPQYHARTDSVSSSQHSSDFSHSSSATTSTTARSAQSPVARKPAPSPLAYSDRNDESTETAYAGSDDEETIGGRSTPTPGEKQKKGLSSKLRKALSLSTLQQVEAAAAAPDRAYGGRVNVATRRNDYPTPQSSGDTNGSSGSTRSTSPPRTPDNGAPVMGSSAASITSRRSTRPPLSNADGGTSKRSIFRSKFNASTDNISISSTVSSASMMLRKVGNLGKLARRSNLKGITNIFKDKGDGREGLQNDDFGTLPVASDEVASNKKDKSKSKKGSPATAAVSHATVELDHQSNGAEAMTPAASYVRQHQLQMRKQAEAERIAREKAEAEKAAAARKTKTTDDVAEGRQKMIEKEKERLKSKRGWRKRLGVGSLGSSSEVQQATGLEVVPLDESARANAGHDVSGGYSGHDQDHSQRGQRGFNDMSYDSAFGEDDLDPPHMPAAEGYESGGDEFETDSLRHWGEGIERSRESAARVKHVRGILKNTSGTADSTPSRTSPAGSMVGKAPNLRGRSNSYDAPQAGNTSATVPPISHITSATTTDRVDGLPRAGDHDELRPDDVDTHPRSPASPPSANSHGGFGHHANSSMPTLSLIMHPSPTGHRSVTAPVARKRLVFADNHIYHSTWPAHVYDRRGELATCNRLTPLLAQRIKEELNTYKMEEMAVAPSSRIHTHFFV